MEIRRAIISDAKVVARLHAESWRNTYRGILSEPFLDHEIFDDRLFLWQKRLSEPQSESQLVLLAEESGELFGFVCVFLDADPRWGDLLDNLHIRMDAQGRGLGRRLMSEAASWVLRQRSGSGLYLWVFEANHQARKFYELLHGKVVERQAQRAPGGTEVMAVRYVWIDFCSFSKTDVD
jgi:GNAT superfamily N-acetyltransferase